MSGQREWKPGDVAIVWINDRREMAIVRQRVQSATQGLEFAYVKGGFDMVDDLAPGWDARPLVVIDPASREQMERLLDAHNAAEQQAACKGGECGSGSCWIDIMRGTFREFANPAPPRPNEPMGLGAVVEDAEGRKWVRADEDNLPWVDFVSGGDFWQSWSDISVTRVLSPGYTEDGAS